MLEGIASIRPANENDPPAPKTLLEIPEQTWQNIKSIPENLVKLPSQLKEVYEKGTTEQQVETAVTVVGSLLSGPKKPPKIGGVVAAGMSGTSKGNKLTKVGLSAGAGLNALKNDLKNLANMSRADIAKAISEKIPSLQYKGGSPDGRFMQWKDASNQTRVRIDPPDAVTPYDHIHLYDSKGNALDINLNIKPANSPDVHIPIKPN